MVPHLTTALTGPLLALERTFLDQSTHIEQWFRSQWIDQVPPFYGSVDLRNSGYKLAPIDMNLFPGGFNNLNADFLPLCVQAAQMAVERICPEARTILLIPENHTRNQFYLQNVAMLVRILGHAGLRVRLGSLSPEVTARTEVVLANGDSLVLEPLVRRGSRLGVEGADPCAILLNNDLSAGVPEILQGLDGQWVIPPLHAGWATRRKTQHFAAYDGVVASFAKTMGLDPWLVNPYFGACSGLDFHERTGEERLAAEVDAVLQRIRQKYREYGVDDKPFVIVKADAGTYGMGVMTVHDASEVVGLNRRQRNKMSVGKEGLQFTEVIVQEGVRTFETVAGGVAEPVVYMIDHHVVGGFYRVNAARSTDENLNAPGMTFQPLAFETCCSVPDCKQAPDAPPNRFYAYGVVARLALLAASVELEQYAPAAVEA